MSEWLANNSGGSMTSIMVVILALVVVLFLAIVLIGLAKRVFAGSGGIGGRSRAPRLAVLDMAPVDPKRKLVLVRRDDVEHLILIGGQNDLVVEPSIVRGQARRPRQEPGFAEPEQRAVPQQQALPHRRTPRPDVQPLPSDGQSPGSHPPIAPVAESRAEPRPEPRPEPAPRAPNGTAERAPAIEARGPVAAPIVAPIVPEPRPEPVMTPPPIPVPPTPSVPVLGPTVASPASRGMDEPPAVRRADVGFPPEPTPPSRRGHDAPLDAPQGAVPAARPAPPVAPPEMAQRRVEPVPAPIERVEPPMTASEPPRQAPVVSPVVPPRPVAPPVAQSVTPPAPVSPPAAPTTVPAGARPASPPSPPSPPPMVAAPAVQAPAAPRSMATPTLPQLSRATPVAPQPRPEPEVSPARSLWSSAPNVTVGPLRAEPFDEAPSRPERDIQPADAGHAPAPMPERVPVRWPPAPIAPRPDESAKADVGFAGPAAADTPDSSPAPLSVKSFATTIQERRAPVPAEPAAVTPPPPTRAPYAPQPEPVAVQAASPPTPPPQREPEMPQAKSEDEERTLTLEEEMERLLHDFTIDVSERR